VSAALAILVTGGASGIGFAIVEAILAEGWRAIAADVSEANLASARQKLGDRPDLRVERLDVADEAAVVKAVAVCEREFGPLAGIVNSAGIARDIPALETSAKTFREVLDVNLIGSFLVAREAAKAMRGRGTGAIVNLASVSGVVGNHGRTAYGASPSNIEDWQKNAYYKSQEDYVFAIAEAMREEYRAIIDAGFLVQIDDPRLVTYYIIHPEASIADCRKWAELRIAALNHALRDIPTEKIRFHTCYGINMGPRIHDMELKDIVDLILTIRAGAYSFEAANPRHEHEWKVWKNVKLPDGKILIPGVISHSTILVEHPELVADRIIRYAEIVGRENVIAGSDCGFATFAGSKEVHPSIVWAKFKALSDGARIASKQLWRN